MVLAHTALDVRNAVGGSGITHATDTLMESAPVRTLVSDRMPFWLKVFRQLGHALAMT